MHAVPLLLLLLACCAPDAPAPRNEEAASRSGDAPAATKPPVFPTILYAEPAALGRQVPVRPGPGLGDAYSVRGKPSAAGAAAARERLRIFPKMSRPAGIVIDIALSGTLILRDGCIRVADGRSGPGEPIAIFSPEMSAWVDDQGFLTVGNGRSGARIGEPVIHAAAPAVDDPALIAAVRKACGEGNLLWVNDPVSAYARALANAGWDAPRAAELRGVTPAEARRNMLEELRRREAERKACAPAPRKAGCAEMPPADSWLMVPPPAPPPTPKARPRG